MYSFLEMNKLMASKIAVLVFRSKFDVSENYCTLILKSVNIIQFMKSLGYKASNFCLWI